MTQTLWDSVVKGFGKHGPWALLATGILCFVGYQTDKFISMAGGAVASYVQQSGENITAIKEATAALTTTGKETQALVSTNSKLLQDNAKIHQDIDAIHKGQNQQIAHLVTLMTDANDMMEPVSEERKKQTAILESIRDAVEKK